MDIITSFEKMLGFLFYLSSYLVVHSRYCSIPDPSWAELRHFVWFLNVQLCDAERSNFCCSESVVQENLPGFFQFVVRFMIKMSQVCTCVLNGHPVDVCGLFEFLLTRTKCKFFYLLAPLCTFGKKVHLSRKLGVKSGYIF